MADEQVNASLDDEDDNDYEEDEEGTGGGFDANKMLLFIVLPLLLIGGIGGGLYFSGMIGGDKTAEDHGGDDGRGAKNTGKHGEGASIGAAFLEIPDMVVNLSSTDGQPRFLRLSVQLELKNEADKAMVEQFMPRVVDQFQTYLRELRVRDLRGSAGIYRLQMELLSRVNAAAYPVEVQDVLFQEILIQ
ncbi:MAG: flagellar basal body protein FliL [Micavibrio sp.]|nr:flagellar basal body protein FliL [Micavibrio sp.]